MNKRQAKIVAYEYIVGVILASIDGGCAVEEFSDSDVARIHAAMEKVAEEMRRRIKRLRQKT